MTENPYESPDGEPGASPVGSSYFQGVNLQVIIVALVLMSSALLDLLISP